MCSTGSTAELNFRKLNSFVKFDVVNVACYVEQMFMNGPTLPSLFSSLMMPPSDDDLDEDSDDEDEEEETAGDRLLMRASRRQRRNRRRSGLSRHNVPWPVVEPRGFFPRYVTYLCS